MSYLYSQPIIFKRFYIFSFVVILGLLGCSDKGPALPPEPDVELIITDKSIVFNDIKTLSIPFSFAKTMDKIVLTSGGAPTSSALMLRDILDSFSENSFVHPVSGKTIAVTARPLESILNPADLLNPDSPDGMIPVGLFNRFDLAPADGSNCGEYRIVYAKRSSGPLDRLTMIFEARIPNPGPSQGLAGCSPITDFWAQRSNDTEATQTVAELEKFYYQGIPGVQPVVNAENYGLPLGQLRVNLFKTPDPSQVKWSLREFLVSFDENDGRAIFKPEPVDDSPTAALFRASKSLPDGFNETDHSNFHASFLGQSLCNLVNPDRIDSKASAADIINGIRAGYSPKFNDFESISQDDDDNPAVDTDAQLLEQVQARIASLMDLSGISPGQLMNRAGTMTCGGCHQFSAGKELGNGATWPPSLGFVHIDEAGKLSPLLMEVFIPQRVQIAQEFKKNRGMFQQIAAPCPSIDSTSKSLSISQVKKAREHDNYKNVDTIRDQFRQVIQAPLSQIEKSEKIKTILPELKEATDLARKQERTNQGAYTPARTH